jgi:uncharacterized membrane protein YsdA (DUF1294 family)
MLLYSDRSNWAIGWWLLGNSKRRLVFIIGGMLREYVARHRYPHKTKKGGTL